MIGDLVDGLKDQFVTVRHDQNPTTGIVPLADHFGEGDGLSESGGLNEKGRVHVGNVPLVIDAHDCAVLIGTQGERPVDLRRRRLPECRLL